MNRSFKFRPHEIGVFQTQDADIATANFAKSCMIVGLTMGNFSLIDLIHSLLRKTGPADLYIATWSAGIKDVHQVRWLLDTNLIRGVRLLTDHSYVNRQRRYAASITDLFGAENIRCSEMHAKFVLIENDDYKVCILSSMNLNANKTCESFQIYEGDDVFDLYMEFVNHHFDNMRDGWESSSSVVGRCVKAFFDKHSADEGARAVSHWSEM